jgi:outer membrane protein assembly factor BamB
MIRRPAFPKPLVPLLLALCVVWPCAGSEWAGFRGLKHQGNVTLSTAPSQWSRTDNIAWTTKVKGSGHSSPVVHGNALYVTTAYPTVQGKKTKAALTISAYGLAVLVTILGGRTLADACRTRRVGLRGILSLFGLATFSLALLLIVLLVLFGPHVLDYQRCPIRGWLGTCLLMYFCILVIDFQLSITSNLRLATGILWLLISGMTVAGLPCKEHAFSHGWPACVHSFKACIVILFAAFPLLTGIVGVTSWWHAIRSAETCIPGSAHRKRSVMWNSVVQAVFWLLAAYCGFLVFPARSFLSYCFCLSLIVPGFYLWSWTLSGYVGITEPDTRATFREFAGNLTAVVSIVTLSSVGIVTLLWLVVNNSPAMYYYLANPSWTPRLGWLKSGASVSFFVVGVALVFFAARRKRVLLSRSPTILRTAVFLLAAILFVNDAWLRSRTTFARAVVCLDRASGEVRFVSECFWGPVENLHRHNSPATPTPVIWRGHVYAHFGSCGIACLSSDGQTRWVNDAVRFHSSYGIGASPVAYDGVLVISNGVPEDPLVYALDCDDGKLLWQQKMQVHPISGSNRTPLIVLSNGRPVVLIWDSLGVAAYELYSGDQVMSCPITTDLEDHVASLTTDGDHIYCAGVREVIALTATGFGKSDTRIEWRTRVRGPNCASPVLCNKMLFFVSDDGVASCLNTSTGHLLWKARIPGSYFSSPIAFGGKIYFCNLEGLTTVVAAENRFIRVAENSLGEDTYATFAPLEHELFVRTRNRVWCIR